MTALRHPRTLIAVLLVPLLVVGVGLWALKDRADRLSHVPAAVVNLDAGTHMKVDGKDQFVPFGRSIAGAITQPGTSSQKAPGGTTGFDWRLTDKADADKGLRDGKYAAVIVIPKSFSADLATLGTTDARKAKISVTTNDASGVLDSAVGAVVAQAAASATGSELTKQYLSQLYLGFNQVKDSFRQSADGAEKLDDGARALAGGLGQSARGTHDLASGADGIATGTRGIADGADKTAKGMHATADGTTSLADGLGQLADGSAATASGTRSLADGLGQLADGSRKSADGAQSLAGGLDRLAGGAHSLSDGAAQLRDGIVGTSSQPGLVTGVEQLRSGVRGDGTAAHPGLVAGAKQLATGSSSVADGIRTAFEGDGTAANPGLVKGSQSFADGVQKYTAGVDGILSGSGSANPGLQKVSSQMMKTCASLTPQQKADPTIAALCQQAGATSQYVDGLAKLADSGAPLADAAQKQADGIALAAHGDGSAANPGLVKGSRAFADGAATFAEHAPEIVSGVDQLVTGVHKLGDGSRSLASGASSLADGVDRSAQGAHALADGSGQLASGTRESADGASQLADGSSKVADGTRKSADGATALADGSHKLADGSTELAGGAGKVADGAGSLADGAHKLADGSDKLSSGASQLSDGSGKLASGLREGADKAPSYSDAERAAMSEMAAQPVSSFAHRQNATDGAATGVFPFVTVLALWMGAFASFLLLPALRRRLLDAAVSLPRAAWRSLLPALLIGLAQSAVIIVMLTLLGIRPVSPLSVGLLIVAGALAFAAIHQALITVLGGRVGRIASLILLVLQAVVLAGILPLETAPTLLAGASSIMPLTILTDGLLHASVGGALASTPAVLLALLAWGGGAFVITLLAGGRVRSHAPLAEAAA